MVSLLAVRGDDRQADPALGGPGLQVLVVSLPDLLPPGLNRLPLFQLGIEDGGQQVGGQVARAQVDPGVFIHLAPEETAAVGAFLPDDLGPLDVLGVVDQQGPSLAAGEVLGLVETLGGHTAEGAQVLALVAAEEAVGVVFHHCHPVAVGDLQDRVHFAADPGVVHRQDGPGAGAEQGLQAGLVEVEAVGADIAEDRAGPAQHEGVDRGDEGKGRHDDLVAGLDVQEQGRHLQGMGAGGSQQGLGHPQDLFQQGMAAPGKGAIPGNMSAPEGLVEVLNFIPDESVLVEGDCIFCHQADYLPVLRAINFLADTIYDTRAGSPGCGNRSFGTGPGQGYFAPGLPPGPA